MANIKDIAALAAVGVNSVSRYLNRPEALKPSTARKIRDAMKELGYVPSLRRPGRKTSRRAGLKHYKVILLTLSDIAPSRLLTMPAYSLYLDALIEEFNRWDISLEFCTLGPDGRVPDRISTKHCDGVVLFQKRPDRKFMSYLYERLNGLPVVWSFNAFYDPENRYDKVVYDNDAVGALAAGFLHDAGCEKALALTNTFHHAAYAARVRDFLESARRWNMAADTIRDLPDGDDVDNPTISAHIARQLKENPKFRDADGLFFVSDSVMTGAMIEYRALGGDFGRFKLLGCNANLQMLDFFERIPPSIDIKLAGVGRRTADRLLQRINSGNSLPPANLILAPDIVTLTHRY